MTPRDVPLASIRIDGGTQPRAKVDTAVVSEYCEALQLGENLPPVELFYDGKDYWLADGFHRYHAGRKAGLDELPANVRTGTQRDAVLYSVGANASHGLRRTNEDKRQAVLTLLNDPEWSKWSSREIANRCNVSNPFVSEIRSHLLTLTDESGTVTFKRGNSEPATMKTGGIAKAARDRKTDPRKPPEAPAPVAASPEPDDDEELFDPEEDFPTAPTTPAAPATKSPKPKLPVVCERAIEVSRMFQEMIRTVNKVVKDAKELATKAGGEWLILTAVTAPGEDMRLALKGALYGGPCPKCHGRGCQSCKHAGWLPKQQYKIAMSSQPEA